MISFKTDDFIEQFVTEILIEEDKKNRKEHVSSGKLTASALGNPLQWQILHVLGVPDQPVDAYTLRKFKRGRDVEEQVIEWLRKTGNLVDEQKEVSYRNTVGLIDAMMDIPHEIKSITNANFKWITKRNEPNESHVLQATLYALAEKSKEFAIDYIASDDYRIKTFIIPTNYASDQVESIITRFEEAMESQMIPEFEAIYEYQRNPLYAKYQEWMLLNSRECEKKLEREYPDAYKKLKGGDEDE
jgi:hypothetical protein